MTHYFKKFAGCLLLAVLSCFINCEKAAECISGISPNLSGQALAEGTRHQPYSQTITAHMTRGQDSDYQIASVEMTGNLPEGIQYETTGLSITVSGTPENAGDYEFGIKIIVRPYLYPDGNEDGLCGNVATQTYRIKINWAN